MRFSHATLYRRLLASDPTYDGRFFTGVLTTGIYCLPSCRARKPLAQNVRFFPSCEAARAAGLRPCKKCHPDDYARGVDPVLEAMETVAAELRADPARFADPAALIRRSGYGASRAHELFRQHFHATPAELIAEARLAAARARLLTSDAPPAEIAFAVGYESLSTFHEAFRTRTGLTPAETRALPRAGRVTLALPADYPRAQVLAALGRDPQSLSERVETTADGAATVRLATRLGERATLLTLEFPAPPAPLASPAADAAAAAEHAPAPTVTLVFAPDLPAALRPEAAARVARLLGLAQDAAGFARLAKKLGLARLVAGRESLRLVQYLDPWDALLWAILGQQINLPFAFRLRRTLTELAGEPVGDGLRAPPAPAAVAALAPETLHTRQFSRQKTRYLLDTARLVASGALDLDKLAAGSATRAERTLREVRGLGPWTVNYVMMRGLGFADCTPYGDTGLTSGLQTLLSLDQRPDVDATRRLMLPFAPHRSLATAHLWQL